MREIPILFSIPMVRAITAGIKTQTRRLRGLEKYNDAPDNWYFSHDRGDGYFCFKNPSYEQGGHVINPLTVKVPYQIGDILWVKEMHYRYGRWTKNGFSEKTGRQKWKFRGARKGIAIRYMDNPPELVRRNGYRKLGWYKRNSLFMPKTASRLRLQITNVKAERLNTISEKDTIREGIKTTQQYTNAVAANKKRKFNSITAYMYLWEDINGAGSWNKNPWVWVVEFKVMKGTYLTILLNKGEVAYITTTITASRKYEYEGK